MYFSRKNRRSKGVKVDQYLEAIWLLFPCYSIFILYHSTHSVPIFSLLIHKEWKWCDGQMTSMLACSCCRTFHEKFPEKERRNKIRSIPGHSLHYFLHTSFLLYHSTHWAPIFHHWFRKDNDRKAKWPWSLWVEVDISAFTEYLALTEGSTSYLKTNFGHTFLEKFAEEE